MRQRDSRALIAAAAQAEFAKHGFAGARVERIARRAGVNKQLLFYYFGSKAGLYQAIMDGVAGEATVEDAQGVAHRPALDQFRGAFAALFDALIRRPQVARLLTMDAQQPGGVPTASRRTLARFLERLSRAVAEGQGHGYFRDEVEPERAAQQALVLAMGYFTFEDILTQPPDPEAASKWRDDAVDLLLRALSW